jgi:hypothetical protein
VYNLLHRSHFSRRHSAMACLARASWSSCNARVRRSWFAFDVVSSIPLDRAICETDPGNASFLRAFKAFRLLKMFRCTPRIPHPAEALAEYSLPLSLPPPPSTPLPLPSSPSLSPRGRLIKGSRVLQRWQSTTGSQYVKSTIRAVKFCTAIVFCVSV